MSEFLPEVIRGTFNNDVVKTLLFVKENPGVNNPIYIFGPSGIGKTFTIKSFLSYFSESRYIKADKITKDSIPELGRYKVLAIDNFHLIRIDLSIQSMIIDIIDEYIENKNQVILIADRHIEKLPLEEGLKSRISGGMVIEFKPLDEVSKNKIIDIMGKDIPQPQRAELYDKPFKDIRKIEGEIKKLRVLGKTEAHPIPEKKVGEDFNGFINALRKEVPEDIGDVTKGSEEERLREEYREKMYVWKMKGFKIDNLKEVIDNGTIEDITGAFVSFTTNVQRLIELHRRYGMLDRRYFPKEAEEIEEKLFDPDSFMLLEEKISRLEHKVDLKRKFSRNLLFDKTIETFVVSDTNKEIYERLSHLVSSPFEGDNPIIVVGGRGTGKTHLLNAFAQEFTKKFPRLLVAYLPFHIFLAEGKAIKRTYADADILFVDDFHHIIEKGYIEDITFIITKLLKSNKRVIISTAKSPKFLRILNETKELLARGKIVYLNPPDKKIKIAMAEKIIQSVDTKGKDIDINAVADKVQGGYYDIDVYIFSLIEKVSEEKEGVKIPEKKMPEGKPERLPVEKEGVKLEEIISTGEREIESKKEIISTEKTKEIELKEETKPVEIPSLSETEIPEKKEKKPYEGIDMKLDDFKERVIEEI